MMKNTLIANAEDMVVRYREAMMDFLNDTQGDQCVEDFADDLMTLAKTLKNLSSPISDVALKAFKSELAAGYTMMMFSNKEFDTLEAWSKDDEDFQIAIFRENGTAVGLVKKSETNW
jgi:hypothetical protein